MSQVFSILENTGIVPVIALSDVDKAQPLARALVAGGIPVAEVTFRTQEAAEVIACMSRQVPEILVGAGTVLSCAQAQAAIDAGARFIVSPGYNQEVVDFCLSKNIPITPGCCTPSDMERALQSGLTLVKFFPAEQAGGLAFIKAAAAPYGALRFMPTGGINEKNLREYLAFPKVLACGGSWMVPKDCIERGDFARITALCRQAVSHMLDFQLVYASSPKAAGAMGLLGQLLGFETAQAPPAWAQPGPAGALVLRASRLKRARAFLALQGYGSQDVLGEVACRLTQDLDGLYVYIMEGEN